MADIFTKAKRSEVMSRIRGRGNKETEMALARILRAEGITGWRRHIQIRIAERGARKSTSPRPSPQKNVQSPRPSPGLRPPSPVPTGEGKSGEGGAFRVRPDFVIRRLRVVVFVDGCFWHGCPKHSNMPANNRAFWRKKLSGNQTRDRLVTRTLRRAGWRVLRIWEHELARKNAARLLRRIRHALAPLAER